MDKTVFYTALSFFLIEAFVFLGIHLSQLSITKELIGIGAFVFFNLTFAVLLLIGATKDCISQI